MKCLIVEDNEFMREGLRLFLAGHAEIEMAVNGREGAPGGPDPRAERAELKRVGREVFSTKEGACRTTCSSRRSI
jgi:hypothetical protein